MVFTYPLEHELVQRVEEIPTDVHPRHWVIRDDNQQHYHGVVSLDESPLYLELYWKATAREREQLVGRYRLDLRQLLAHGYIRRETSGTDDSDVRLRFHRGDRGVIAIQIRDDAPALAIGVVDMTL
jgi:hypothetical protein